MRCNYSVYCTKRRAQSPVTVALWAGAQQRNVSLLQIAIPGVTLKDTASRPRVGVRLNSVCLCRFPDPDPDPDVQNTFP